MTTSRTAQFDSVKLNPAAGTPEGSAEPLITISGPLGLVSPVKARWVAPSMMVFAPGANSPEVGLIVNAFPSNPGSDVGIRNTIVVGSEGELLDRSNA